LVHATARERAGAGGGQRKNEAAEEFVEAGARFAQEDDFGCASSGWRRAAPAELGKGEKTIGP